MITKNIDLDVEDRNGRNKGFVVLDELKCRGCNSCVLACSFHHLRLFSKEASSIQVSWDYSTGEINWEIKATCDLCEGEKECLCVKYCPYEALTIKQT